MKQLRNLRKFAPDLFQDFWNIEGSNRIKVSFRKNYIKVGDYKLVRSDRSIDFLNKDCFIYHTEESIKNSGNEKVFKDALVFKAKTDKEFILEYLKLITFKGYYFRDKYISLNG